MPCPTPPSLALPAPPSKPPTKTRSKSSATTSTSTTFSGPSKTRATVKIYYEARLAKLDLDANERPRIDPDFEDVTEGEELTTREKLKSKWAQLEAMVGSPKRVSLVAKTWCSTSRTASPPWTAKGMIVCMSRRICVELYEATRAPAPRLAQRRRRHRSPQSGDDRQRLRPRKLSAPHPQQKRPDALAKRLRDPNDPLKLVIVRDMWLTGFDAPCLHTMYVDKPMRGHNLMQAIARVNRVFGGKAGGLVVDYIGIAQDLKEALKDYTERDRGQAGIPMDQAIALLQEKYEVVAGLFHGFDYRAFHTAPPPERLTILRNAMDWLLRPEFQAEKGPQRYLQAVTELSKAFALCAAEEEALAIREDVGFFQAVKAGLSKHTVEGGKSRAELDAAVRQIVSRSVASDQVIDIFETAGLDKPELSILSDQFLEEVRDLPQKNLALEVLRKLLNDEIKARSRKNVVQSRNFSEMLEASIRRYQNRAITSAEVIQELINLIQRDERSQPPRNRPGPHRG
jgi:type I restriction enzyme R subunit